MAYQMASNGSDL